MKNRKKREKPTDAVLFEEQKILQNKLSDYWSVYWSEKTQRRFYFNKDTDESCFDNPLFRKVESKQTQVIPLKLLVYYSVNTLCY
jgi:hypothetical protein